MTERDLPTELTGLARRLRENGVAVDTTRVMTGARALTQFDPLGIEGLYWSTRLAFCSRFDDIARFDAAFNSWLTTSAAAGAALKVGVGAGLSPAFGGGDAEGDAGRSAARAALVAGRAESLASRDVATLTPAERDQVNAMIGLLKPYTGSRRSLRWSPGGRVHVDMARTVRQMMRGYGEPARLRFRRRVRQPRRLVVLLDVSRSMSAYSDALLRFAHAAVRARPTKTEVFTLGTRLTRLTVPLRARDPQAAMSAVAGLTSDWDGGTELGRVLRQFIRTWGGRSALRSAVVVFASDGWESDPALLTHQIGRLGRLAHVVIWANPQAGWDRFRPRAKALRDSLHLVDRHVPGHSFAALRSLAALIASV